MNEQVCWATYSNGVTSTVFNDRGKLFDATSGQEVVFQQGTLKEAFRQFAANFDMKVTSKADLTRAFISSLDVALGVTPRQVRSLVNAAFPSQKKDKKVRKPRTKRTTISAPTTSLAEKPMEATYQQLMLVRDLVNQVGVEYARRLINAVEILEGK